MNVSVIFASDVGAPVAAEYPITCEDPEANLGRVLEEALKLYAEDHGAVDVPARGLRRVSSAGRLGPDEDHALDALLADVGRDGDRFLAIAYSPRSSPGQTRTALTNGLRKFGHLMTALIRMEDDDSASPSISGAEDGPRRRDAPSASPSPVSPASPASPAGAPQLARPLTPEQKPRRIPDRRAPTPPSADERRSSSRSPERRRGRLRGRLRLRDRLSHRESRSISPATERRLSLNAHQDGRYEEGQQALTSPSPQSSPSLDAARFSGGGYSSDAGATPESPLRRNARSAEAIDQMAREMLHLSDDAFPEPSHAAPSHTEPLLAEPLLAEPLLAEPRGASSGRSSPRRSRWVRSLRRGRVEAAPDVVRLQRQRSVSDPGVLAEEIAEGGDRSTSALVIQVVDEELPSPSSARHMPKRKGAKRPPRKASLKAGDEAALSTVLSTAPPAPPPPPRDEEDALAAVGGLCGFVAAAAALLGAPAGDGRVRLGLFGQVALMAACAAWGFALCDFWRAHGETLKRLWARVLGAQHDAAAASPRDRMAVPPSSRPPAGSTVRERAGGEGAGEGRLPDGAEGSEAPRDTWGVCDARVFKVRQEGYAKERRKAGSGPALFRAVAADCIKSERALKSVMELLRAPAPRTVSPVGSFPSLLVVNAIIPEEPPNVFAPAADGSCYSVVMWFELSAFALEELRKAPEDRCAAVRLAERYFAEAPASEAMAGRLKGLVDVPQIDRLGLPGFVKRANGKPVLMTKVLQLHAAELEGGGSAVEIDIDVFQFGVVARKGLSVLFPKFRDLSMHMGFLLEGRAEEELPEQVLCSIDFNFIDSASKPTIDQLLGSAAGGEKAPAGDEQDRKEDKARHGRHIFRAGLRAFGSKLHLRRRHRRHRHPHGHPGEEEEPAWDAPQPEGRRASLAFSEEVERRLAAAQSEGKA